ncbi:ATP-binding cassette domain-containing protein [Dactylosporangium sp. NPDC051541]|uniref:ATP-binding cassette domain-containing protein n=1 Tax=Dactylosporangium sp. NPDC051541 TaxID=3363977 RepID=UPI0037B28FF9
MAIAIKAEGLRKVYCGKPALDGLELHAEAGTVLALLGPNGAGKTTTVRILTTLSRPDAGRAEVGGYDVAREPRRIRGIIGVTGQHSAVDGRLTGRENLVLIGRLHRLGRAEAAARADELLHRLGLAAVADRLAHTYSGGTCRRIDLAAGLINRAPVLFLDEPTTGLDPRSRLELWTLVEDLVRDGTTVLLTTQYLEEADRLAHVVAVVDHGRVVAEGTAAELKRRAGAEQLSVRLQHGADVPVAAAALRRIGLVAADPAAGEVCLSTEDGARMLTEVVRRLDDVDVTVVGVEVRRPSLDDVFLSLTRAGDRTAPGVAA